MRQLPRVHFFHDTPLMTGICSPVAEWYLCPKQVLQLWNMTSPTGQHIADMCLLGFITSSVSVSPLLSPALDIVSGKSAKLVKLLPFNMDLFTV